MLKSILVVTAIVSNLFLVEPRQYMTDHLNLMNRDKLSYEVTKLYFEKDSFFIEGWGFIMDSQHYIDSTTHRYTLVLESKDDQIRIEGSIVNNSKTDLMHYDGVNLCAEDEFNSVPNSCNYHYENVGFKFSFSIDILKINQEYSFYLEIQNLSSSEKGRIELYNPEAYDKEFTIMDYQYQFKSSYQQTKLMINNETVIARVLPGKQSNVLKTELSCSEAYKNNAYFEKNSVYQNIRNYKFDDDIRYFEVEVTENECRNERSRVKEGKKYTAYIPSVYVNYSGTPMILKKTKKTEYPIIEAINLVIDQYTYLKQDLGVTTYNPHNLEIPSLKVLNTVSTNQVGEFLQCFQAINSDQLISKTCRTITVVARQSKYRFINQWSIYQYFDENSSVLNNMLHDNRVIEVETIRSRIE